MSGMKWFIFIVLLIGLAPFYFVSCKDSKPTTHNSRHTTTQKYHCPMHPTYTSDKPGDCPICNMKLVPIEASSPSPLSSVRAEKGDSPHAGTVPGREGEQDRTAVHILPQTQQLIGIKKETVRFIPLSKKIRTYGRVAHDFDLYQTQRELIETAQDPFLHTIVKRKMFAMGIHQDLIEEFEKMKSPDETLILRSPQGFWVYATIYETDIPYVKSGQQVKAISDLLKVSFKGVVKSIDTLLDEKSRSLNARIFISEKLQHTLHNAYLTVEILVPFGARLAIPKDAVIRTGTRKLVYVIKEEQFVPTEIQTGAETEDFFEVVKGLKANDVVVTNASFLVDSESQLKAALSGMKH